MGVPFGVAYACFIDWTGISFFAWVVMHAVALIPTAAQPYIQRKGYKIMARMLLGATSTSYLLSGIMFRSYFENVLLWKSSVILAFALSCKALFTWRQARINDPCDGCPQGRFPTCDWNMPRLLAGNLDDPVWHSIALAQAQQIVESKPDDLTSIPFTASDCVSKNALRL